MGMVFQAYSLFPNMTARQNVEYGLKLRGKQEGGAPQPRAGAAGARRPQSCRRSLPASALGRHAAARCAGARARDRAARPPARRASVGSRREGARAAARGDSPHPARARDHDAVRHARPGGGALGLGPRRGDVRRTDRADGLAGGDVQRSCDAVRRGVHRHDEPARGQGRRRRRGARRHDAAHRGGAEPAPGERVLVLIRPETVEVGRRTAAPAASTRSWATSSRRRSSAR